VGHHHSHLSSAEVKNGWSYISAIPVCLHLIVPTSGIAVMQCDTQNAKRRVKVTTLSSHPCAASI